MAMNFFVSDSGSDACSSEGEQLKDETNVEWVESWKQILKKKPNKDSP